MLRRRAALSSLILAVCLAAGAWAQEPEAPESATAEVAPAEEPQVDAFQHFFGRREEGTEEKEAPAEAPPTDPEAKRDAFQYLFGRRGQVAASEEQPVPVVRVQEAPAPAPQPAPVTAPSPAAAPAPVEAPKAQPAEPKPEAVSPAPLEKPKVEEMEEVEEVEEKPKVDAFQHFFGRKEKQGEPVEAEPEESERPPL